MARKVNTTRLGVFVLIAICIAVISIALFGSGRIFKSLNRYVIFFPESVKGLEVGSPVRFRGIQLGTVVDMQAIYHEEDNKILIPVYIEIERARIRNLGIAPKDHQTQQDNLLKAGLRAQLTMDSIVTGQLAISLDFLPDTKVRLAGADRSIPEIASIPSPLEKISETLQSLPLEDMVRQFSSTLTAIEGSVTSPGFTDGLTAIGPTLTEARDAMDMISKDLRPLLVELHTKVAAFDVPRVSQKLEQSLDSIDKAAANLAALSAHGAPLDSNANRALMEIAAAARQLRQVAEMIERRPEVLLTGKK